MQVLYESNNIEEIRMILNKGEHKGHPYRFVMMELDKVHIIPNDMGVLDKFINILNSQNGDMSLSWRKCDISDTYRIVNKSSSNYVTFIREQIDQFNELLRLIEEECHDWYDVYILIA